MKLAIRKTLTVIISLLLVIAFAIQPSYAKDDESVNLYLDISFESNLLFNKYDVSVELDGEELDTVEYGSYYTKLCPVTPGKHVIRVCKDDDPDVMGEESIQVDEDKTFQCQIKTKGKEVEFVNLDKVKGTAGHSIEMPNCVGLHLVDALEALKQRGYVNFRYEGDTEEKIEEDTWVVDVQSIKAKKKIDKNDEIILTCVPAEKYLEKTFTGLTYSKAIKKANAIGYTNIRKIDSRVNGDEPTDLAEADITKKAKKNWTVKSAKDNYSEDKQIILNFEYTATMPDLTGKGAKKADKQMAAIQQGHFSYIFVGYKTGDYISDKDLKKYKIVEQSLEPGTEIAYKSTITFKCKKTEAARAAEKKAKLAAAAAAKKEAEEKAKEPMVWISGGECYHSKSSCSNMKNPQQVPLSQAKKIGKRACKKCY